MKMDICTLSKVKFAGKKKGQALRAVFESIHANVV
jgi:hypothetical protein